MDRTRSDNGKEPESRTDAQNTLTQSLSLVSIHLIRRASSSSFDVCLAVVRWPIGSDRPLRGLAHGFTVSGPLVFSMKLKDTVNRIRFHASTTYEELTQTPNKIPPEKFEMPHTGDRPPNTQTCKRTPCEQRANDGLSTTTTTVRRRRRRRGRKTSHPSTRGECSSGPGQ
jgi:hypothetical protein